MLIKLVFQNIKRSLREYVIYIVTLVMAAAFMLAFNSLIFSKSIWEICSMGVFVGIMIGFAAVIVFVILFWLVSYIVDFMMKKRSREFSAYQVIGIEEKQVANMFLLENLLLGVGSMLIGIFPGMLLQIILGRLFLSVFQGNDISVEFVPQSILLTGAMFFMILFFVLGKARRKLCKMSIMQLLQNEKCNEVSGTKSIALKKLLLSVSILYFILFDLCLILKKLTMANSLFLLAGFVLCCYLFYIGLSAFLLSFAERKHDGIYRGNTLFFLRQLLSKVQSIRVVMGTITVFFTFAFVSFAIAIMFHDYLGTQISQKLPFDTILYETDTKADFSEERQILKRECQITAEHTYHIYQNGSTIVRDYMTAHKKGSSEVQMTQEQADYFALDTYMKLSDYNMLMRLLGREEISLSKQSCLIQTKQRFVPGLQELMKDSPITIEGVRLSCDKFCTEGFALNGQNGADFVMVIPDEYAVSMRPYYSLYAASLEGELSEDNYNELQKKVKEKNTDEGSLIWGRGTDDFVTVTDMVQVKAVQGKQICFVLGALSYPLVYIGIIMLCVGITILSVQQLSDLSKYHKNYSILQKMGVSEQEAGKMIGKQVVIFYILPYLTAFLIGSGFTVWISTYFVYYTGIQSFVLSYFMEALAVVTAIYGMYFLSTWTYMKKAVLY